MRLTNDVIDNFFLNYLFFVKLDARAISHTTSVPSIRKVMSKFPNPPSPASDPTSDRCCSRTSGGGEAAKAGGGRADGGAIANVFYEMFGDPVKNERGWDIVRIEEIFDEITVGIVVALLILC